MPVHLRLHLRLRQKLAPAPVRQPLQNQLFQRHLQAAVVQVVHAIAETIKNHCAYKKIPSHGAACLAAFGDHHMGFVVADGPAG